ncbi:hypothetical protein B0H10DRAFT_2198206 [Mycena sp. CBHHK59/15]|nr:hypothetical protein B0H10DRAFT_2198206 [Mycena sp. CBHHK59/15]
MHADISSFQEFPLDFSIIHRYGVYGLNGTSRVEQVFNTNTWTKIMGELLFPRVLGKTPSQVTEDHTREDLGRGKRRKRDPYYLVDYCHIPSAEVQTTVNYNKWNSPGMPEISAAYRYTPSGVHVVSGTSPLSPPQDHQALLLFKKMYLYAEDCDGRDSTPAMVEEDIVAVVVVDEECRKASPRQESGLSPAKRVITQ